MAEVEADLTRREADLRAQRDRVTALRARMSLSGPINDAVDDPGLVTYLAAVRSAGAAGPAIDRDGELLSLVGGDDATELGGLLAGMADDPAARSAGPPVTSLRWCRSRAGPDSAGHAKRDPRGHGPGRSSRCRSHPGGPGGTR